MATVNCMAACDYVGIVSGNKEPNKFAKAGFHAAKSEFVDAPPIIFDPMNRYYLVLGERVGQAFHDGMVLK